MDEKHITMLERIHSELVGDEFTEGLIPEHKKMKKKIERHDKYFGVLLGIISVGSILVAFWTNFISIFK